MTGVYLRTLLIMHAINIFLNWVLIFGNLGAPELGVFGAGLATGNRRIDAADAPLAAGRCDLARDVGRGSVGVGRVSNGPSDDEEVGSGFDGSERFCWRGDAWHYGDGVAIA